jgi:glycosyltransferase involved in cell wall biosynthesis
VSRALYVEVSSLLSKHLTGIGRVVARLVEALSAHTDLRLVSCEPPEAALSPNVVAHLLSGEEMAIARGELPSADDDLEGWVRRLFRRRRLPHDRELARQAACLFTGLRPLKRHFHREVGLLYDFSPLTIPWIHSPDTQHDFGRFFSETVRLCDRVIALSQSTRFDASWLTSLPEEKVAVVYPGRSLCVHDHAFAPPVARRDKVILIVSALELRTNGRFLIDWFLETEALEPGFELWWVGPKGSWTPKGWLEDLIARGRQRGRRGQRVRFLGAVSDRELCRLYQQATFTVHPSLYEGFGFPVLDSLRHGTPVLASCHSALQEFAGPGVFYFDPLEQTTLDDACRELLAAMGRERVLHFERDDLAARYSWNEMAQTVLSMCTEAACGLAHHLPTQAA